MNEFIISLALTSMITAPANGMVEGTTSMSYDFVPISCYERQYRGTVIVYSRDPKVILKKGVTYKCNIAGLTRIRFRTIIP